MTKPVIRSFLVLLFLLCLSNAARGQTTITISGDDTVCTGSTYQYSAYLYHFPPNTYNRVVRMDWTITRGSEVLNVPPDDKRILWGSPGQGKVVVNGYDTANNFVVGDTFMVWILASPTPRITTTSRVDCQPLDDPGEFNPPKGFDDSACQKICAYNTVTYYANGNPSSTYEWTVIGGTHLPTSGPSINITWGAPGGGKITVKEISSFGCEGEASACIDIVESPLAHFVAMPDTPLRVITICKGSEVIFIDKSTFAPSSPIVAWKWDFGDGSFSNQKGSLSAPISHKYDVPGTYTVSLTVTNDCGCSTTDTMVIHVDPAAGIKIECPGVVCENAIYDYNVDASCTGGTWTVIGGSVVFSTGSYIRIRWDAVNPAQGFGYIVYDPGGCAGYCPYPVALKIPVVRTNAIIQGPNFLCPNKQYLYTLPQWPTTKFNWTVNTTNVTLTPTDQPNEVVLTPNVAGGTVTLTCNYFNTLMGCGGTATKVIQIPGEVKIIDTIFDFCEGLETAFHAAGPNIASGQWTLLQPDNTKLTGSGSTFNVSFSQVGTYLLTLKGNFCPPDPIELHVIGYPDPPESITGPGRICKGIPEEYLAGVVDSKHTFAWSINKSSSLNTTVGAATEVTLNPASTYPFELSAYRVTKVKPYCMSSPTKKTIDQPVLVTLFMGEDSVCPSSLYKYSTANEEAESYEWKIIPEDMGSVDSGQGTSKVFILWNKKPGPAKVAVRLGKCYDAYTYDTMDVYVRPLAINLTLTDDTICLFGSTFAEVDVATNRTYWFNGIEGYHTDAGIDFTSLSYGDPITTYTTYTVRVGADSIHGCPAKDVSDSAKIVVIPSPKILVTPPYFWGDCNTLPNVTVTTEYDTMGITPTSYAWYKNGVLLSNTASSYTVTDTAIYKVVVAGSFGCSTSREIKSQWRSCSDEPGTGPSQPGPNCAGKQAKIKILRVDKCGDTIMAKGFNTSPSTFTHGVWGGNNDSLILVTFTDSTATYISRKAGYYRIWYTAWFSDGNGGFCSSTADSLVVDSIATGLEITPLCSQIDEHRIIKITDHSTSILPFTERAFVQREPGTLAIYDTLYKGLLNTWTGASIDTGNATTKQRFRVWLKIGTTVCMRQVDTTVPPLPLANFSFRDDSTCQKDAAVFYLNTGWPKNNICLWDFGDNTANNQPDPFRVYETPGLKTVKLRLTDRWGCMDSITKNVWIVSDNLDGRVEITPPFPCEGSSASALYTDLGSSVGTSFVWHDKNAQYVGSGANPWPLYKSGYYYAVVQDRHRCSKVAQGDTVTFIKAPPALIYGDGVQCQDVPFTLSGYAGQVAGLTYSWSDGSPIAGANGPELKLKISTPGTYYYTVTTTTPKPDGSGFCSNTSDPFEVVVHPTPDKPTLSFTVLDCNEYTIRLNVTNTSTLNNGIFNWSAGLNGTPVDVHHGGPFQVTYTDTTTGCMSKEKIQTPKDLREYLWMFPTGCYSLCSTKANIITGPIIPFKQWRYLHNGFVPFTPGASGSNSIPLDQNITPWGPGYIQLYLENDYCNITSDTMEVDYDCIPNGPGRDTSRGWKPDPTSIKNLVSAPAQLALAPNPATNSTKVSYHFTASDIPAYIQVYDVLGRVIYGRQIFHSNGSFDLSLEDFAPGTYRVILLQGNAILKHTTLSVTRQ